MVIKLIEDKNRWDQFIDNSTYGTLFHKWDFLKIIEKYSGYQLHPYGIYRRDELICVFPIYTKEYMGAKIVASPPSNMAVPYLGFIMSQIAPHRHPHCDVVSIYQRLNIFKTKFNPALRTYYNVMKKNLVYKAAKNGENKMMKIISI